MKKVVIMDGAVGTSLWEKATDKVPVWRYNIENPKIVRELQEEYVQAGADIVLADTFAANGAEVARCSSYTVEQVVSTAVRIAKDTVNGRAKVGLAIARLPACSSHTARSRTKRRRLCSKSRSAAECRKAPT